jgi:NAD(P)-dependent dehydrogenase (short-subunit alcohol dehydrogenase family)
MRLRGAVALVTGGSSGIGAATARALAQAGARPLIAGRDAGRLAEVARQTGGTALAADLATPDGPAELAEAAQRAAGPDGIDLLINNAGIGWAGPIGQLTAERTAQLIAVNLTAPIELTRLLVPEMTARRRGHIVFVSSIAGATAVRGEAVYSAAKAGLGYFAESLDHELAGTGVRTSLIVPGVFDTPFFEHRGGGPRPDWGSRAGTERGVRAGLAAVPGLAARRAAGHLPQAGAPVRIVKFVHLSHSLDGYVRGVTWAPGERYVFATLRS